MCVLTCSSERYCGVSGFGEWCVCNSYRILSFCYQVGVFVSRSSLPCVKITHVEVLTALQGANMVYWILQGKYKLIVGPGVVWVQFLLMTFCGLMGGAMYVNTFYLILHDKKYPDKDRELCVNITAFAQSIGIIFSSIFDIILSTFVFVFPAVEDSFSESSLSSMGSSESLATLLNFSN